MLPRVCRSEHRSISPVDFPEKETLATYEIPPLLPPAVCICGGREGGREGWRKEGRGGGREGGREREGWRKRIFIQYSHVHVHVKYHLHACIHVHVCTYFMSGEDEGF